MNVNNFQETTTRRGYVYSYYHKRPTDGNPTVLFLHGFPETHRDWSSQITYFSNKGYGIIAPDLLGYGRTSAPNDSSEYKLLDMVEDIIDVLNDLKVSKVIGVAHDWGCFVLSRLLNTHIDYVIGAAFLVAGYVPPQPTFNLKAQIATLKTLLGYEVIGYWEFFGANDAPALFEKNIDSLYSLIFPDDPSIWKEDLAPIGKAREWIEQKKKRPRAAFWTEEEQEAHKAAVMQKGLRGPCNWYKSNIEELNNADDRSIPLEAYNISIPTFFGGALKDQSSLKALEVVKTMMSQFCSNTTMKDFDSGHWVMQEVPSAVNGALEEFFATLF
ncbi:Alpha/Beta hydrolase protein [Collybia nuda]|uniref:Alpha/Beta hydrolase protein n=1 Tax=Collybia nuda TaxID=64659 RepID=A0A9P6CHZ9_9AGAR|nr:Alpha/Beta hydrolase protein [Collybia nuda]